MDRRRRSERRRRSGQCVVQPDAASVRIFVSMSRAGRGKDAGAAARDRDDARHRAARRAGCAPACRAVESRM